MTIDRWAEIQPGMAAVLKVVGERYTLAYYAAKGEGTESAASRTSDTPFLSRTPSCLYQGPPEKFEREGATKEEG